jgi:hypothetical protein
VQGGAHGQGAHDRGLVVEDGLHPGVGRLAAEEGPRVVEEQAMVAGLAGEQLR